MGGHAISGIQDQNVMANVKHFVANNQETDRGIIDEHIDERTRFEIYYPPFQGAIDHGVGSMMCSYNRVNGVHSCMNNSTLNTDLRERMGFKGYVLSDWGATSSMAIQYGMEQEMDGNPANVLYTEAAVSHVPNATLDTAVERIMYSWF